jgi:ribonuclease P protein component
VADDRAWPPRVAYAVGRGVGNAVTRNRVRRRLRAALAAQARVGLPAGWYLVGATPGSARASFAELETAVASLARRVRTEAAR